MKLQARYVHNVIVLLLMAIGARVAALVLLVNTHVMITIRQSKPFLENLTHYFADTQPAIYLGLLSDAVVCLLLAALMLALHKWLARILLVIMMILFAANALHIYYNLSNISFYLAVFAADKNFIEGQLFDPNLRFVLLCILLPVGVYWILKFRYSRFTIFNKSYWMILPALPVLVLFWFFTAPLLAYESWLQQNVLEENARHFLYKTFSANDGPQGSDALYQAALFGQEVGQPLSELTPTKLADDTKPNILIVFVESLSQYYLEHNLAPKIQQLAGNNLSLKQFIAPQLQTHRGLYSAFCADYPNLAKLDSKSIDLLFDPNITLNDCLPQRLANLGYATRFLKSSRLDFTLTGDFAKAIGFQRAFSALEDNAPFNSRFGWGIDDRALYAYAATHINSLQQGNQPWFMSIVTSGTHAPYNVPPNYLPEVTNRRDRAYGYADDAVLELVSFMQKSGALENTLVIITADESRVFDTAGSPVYKDLILNWIPLLMLLPGEQKQIVIDDYYALYDLPKTILDYLGQDIAELPGRSFLRRYQTPRPMLFGNVFKDHIFVLDEQRRLRKCKTSRALCFDIDISAAGLFDDNYVIPQQTPKVFADLNGFLQLNDRVRNVQE